MPSQSTVIEALLRAHSGVLRVDAPRRCSTPTGLAGTMAKRQTEQREKAGQSWQRLTQLPRFKVASAVLTNGEVSVVGVPAKKAQSSRSIG